MSSSEAPSCRIKRGRRMNFEVTGFQRDHSTLCGWLERITQPWKHARIRLPTNSGIRQRYKSYLLLCYCLLAPISEQPTTDSLRTGFPKIETLLVQSSCNARSSNDTIEAQNLESRRKRREEIERRREMKKKVNGRKVISSSCMAEPEAEVRIGKYSFMIV